MSTNAVIAIALVVIALRMTIPGLVNLYAHRTRHAAQPTRPPQEVSQLDSQRGVRVKPRVFSQVWIDMATDRAERRWHVKFEDSCGYIEEEDFATAETARRFALHIAGGGSRWEFVA